MRLNSWREFREALAAASAVFLVTAVVHAADEPKTRPRVEATQPAKENLDAARQREQEAREKNRESRQDGREAVRDDRGDVREARRDVRDSRREFRREAIRSADIGLWLRRLAGGRTTVSDITAGGVAAGAGFREGDQIVSVNGQAVATEREFIDALFTDEAKAQPAKVVVVRDGKELTLTIQPKALIEEFMAAESDPLLGYGIIVDDRSSDRIVVQRVIPRSPAYYAGLRSGDVITGVRGQRILALADFVRSLVDTATGSTTVEINRNNLPRELEIEMPQNEVQRTLKPNLDDPNLKAPADVKPKLDPTPPPKPAIPAVPVPRKP